ncbi:MAG: amidase, partial [Rhodoferax sp.]|nr:amidase [Rhodoferax sp.]
RDLARLLAVQAGFDPRVPLSLDDPHDSLVPPADVTLDGVRIGWLGDLDGHLPLEPGIAEVCESALHRMADAGAHMSPARMDIDLEAVWRAWLVWRRALVAPAVAAVMQTSEQRGQVKPEALWEHDGAQDLRFDTFLAASVTRGSLLQAMLALFERYDVLALPVAQVWPFDLDQPWPREITGHPMDTYHRWMETTIYATFAGLPAISVPAGFDASGRWPMGLQLIGRPRADAALLRIAAGYEAVVPELLARRPSAVSSTTAARSSPAA